MTFLFTIVRTYVCTYNNTALYKCCKYAVMKISGKKLEPESDMTQV